MGVRARCPCEAAAQQWRLKAGPGQRRCALRSFQASRHLRPSAVRPAAAAADGSGGQLSGGSPGQQQLEREQQHAPLPPYAAWPVTARVALRTGAYIAVLGLALFLLPSLFGTVFDARWVQQAGLHGASCMAHAEAWPTPARCAVHTRCCRPSPICRAPAAASHPAGCVWAACWPPCSQLTT